MKQTSILKQTARPLGLLVVLLLMLLLPATLTYGAYLPLPSAPNALDSHHNHDDNRVEVSQKSVLEQSFDCTTVSQIPQIECEALVALYESTDGANWSNNSDWLNSTTPCSWYGVTCSSGHITRLNLYDNQLSGTIPAQLANLANLTHLDLHSNQLSGSIPPELGNLANLVHLNLRSNQLSGSIPSELGNLANLRSLWLYDNQLSGSIPAELGKLANLTSLWLHNNDLSGSIPSELGNLANLTNLALFGNQLSGSIPPELGNLVNLTQLQLQNNPFSGSIPPELGNLTNLTTLSLYNNQLSGSIPSELGNLTNLTRLNLSHNQLSGTIPPELANLVNLTNLYLHQNPLSGSILVDFTNLNLDSFYFSDTDLCEPNTPAFQSWLSEIDDLSSTNVTCPTNVILLCSVDLQDRPSKPDSRWSVPLNVSLTVPGESVPAYTFTPTTDENGTFTISGIVPGTYELRLKHSRSLQNKLDITLVGGDNSADCGTLREGDANDDNFVTLPDFSILAATFGKCEDATEYDARADFNADTCVTLRDFSLLSANFGQSGE